MMYLCVVLQPRIAQVNTEDILDSFMDSYKLGIKIIKGDYLWQTYIQCSFSFILYYRICVSLFSIFPCRHAPSAVIYPGYESYAGAFTSPVCGV